MGKFSIAGYGIRRATAEDVIPACEIAKKAWVRVHDSFRAIMGGEMHDVLCEDWEENKAAQVAGHFERVPNCFYVVVREEDNRVVGFITFRIDEEKSLGTIGNNAIDPICQGKGVGTAMYEYVLDLFRTKGLRFASVTTGLDEGHAPARGAYEKAGFDIRQENVTYYKKL
ncbi:MAG: GNAT family N-acetyltransferase [Candidatus Latescibacteria bacterium]|nr:GNAT family N-acetyltransferase [Candidatus Latescibacterota bacterium]